LDDSAARDEIVRYGRALWDRRLVTGTSGNISVRLDDGDILVTPAGTSLGSLLCEHIVRTDRTGVVRDRGRHPTSELPLHLAAYGARADVAAVVHSHPTFCVVWSKLETTLPRDTVGASETLGEVACTPYRAPGSQELAEITAVEFARGIDSVIMARHGLSTVGACLEDAFMRSDLAEEAARIAYFCRLALGETASRSPR
jgi:L-fuculose-phosphate aldolase